MTELHRHPCLSPSCRHWHANPLSKHVHPTACRPKVDHALLERLATGKHELVSELTIPPRDGRAWVVKAGQLWRIVCTEGPQVADMNVWQLQNPKKERFYTSKTRQLHASHLTMGDRLWSCFPYLRPLATITADTISYGIDKDGAGVHDVIGSRCVVC